MILVVFLYLSSFSIISFTKAFITPVYIGNYCPSSSFNFTINSTYHSNLKLLFSTLSSNATFNTSNGLSQVFFSNATAGQAPDEVYGLFLCRRDLNSTTCQDCVTYATRHVTAICPTRKLATIWYDECHLRYSNESFFSIVSQNPAIWMPNTENVTEPDKFDDSVLSFMNAAASKAAISPDKFVGAKKENFRVNETLYGLVQCTQDLSSRDCFTCLRAANADLPVCCGGKRGGRVLTPSCNSRFELYSFFNESYISTVEPAPAPAPPPAPRSVTESQGKRRQAAWIAIGTIIPTIIVLMLSGHFLPLIWRRYKVCLCRGESKKTSASSTSLRR
ncbi:hypothetical protein Patl1_12061 [Pistacia atlantica]|uniref:Uncharacterized protein n=1 Tax=Pistacia atlantica TaxID=434234 RepID=A0ACC1A644_9ROSI|nr:hypothetical protein Patl1_12061 [Pistacia atlantica]